jgi:excisionase family DNA binding protein
VTLRKEKRVMAQRKLTDGKVREVVLGSGCIPSSRPDETSGTSGGETAASPVGGLTPWLTPKEAAGRARCGVKMIYREVKGGRLRAARIAGRRELRMKPEWVDAWLESTATPVEVAA